MIYRSKAHDEGFQKTRKKNVTMSCHLPWAPRFELESEIPKIWKNHIMPFFQDYCGHTGAFP